MSSVQNSQNSKIKSASPQNNNNGDVCPVSLNTKKEILNDGRKLFFIDKKFYDAAQLKQWIDCGHTTFPHSRKDITIKHIEELNDILGIENKLELTTLKRLPDLNLKHIGKIPDNLHFAGQSVKLILMEALVIMLQNPDEIKYQDDNMSRYSTLSVENYKQMYLSQLAKILLTNVYYIHRISNDEDKIMSYLVMTLIGMPEDKTSSQPWLRVKVSLKHDDTGSKNKPIGVDLVYFDGNDNMLNKLVNYDMKQKPVYIVRNGAMEVYPKLNLGQVGGKVMYKKKSYKVHVGVKGGKYIVIAGKKKYL